MLGVEGPLHHGAAMHVATALIAALLCVATVSACRDRRARPVVAVMLANFAVLFASPVYFPHYGALVAALMMVVLVVGLGPLVTRLRLVAALAVACAVACCLASGFRVASIPAGRTFPAAALATGLPAGCLSADDPIALIDLDRLSSDLRAGCRLPVDVTGVSYDRNPLRANGSLVPRKDDAEFQSFLLDYLLSGKSFVVLRAHSDAFDSAVAGELRQRPVLAAAGPITLRAGRR